MSFATKVNHEMLLLKIPKFSIRKTVSEAKKKLIADSGKFDTFRYVYIIDGEELVGVMSIKEMMQVDGGRSLSEFCDKELVTVNLNSPLRVAVAKAMKSSITSVPVVNRSGDLLGVIGGDLIIETLNNMHISHILRHSGFNVRQDSSFTDVIRLRVRDLIAARAPWILFGLIGGMLATIMVSLFEATLQEVVALAFFMPLVVYFGDAIGMQTQMLYVRALMFEHMSGLRFAVREFIVDGILAAIGALMIGTFAYLLGYSPEVMAIVMISIFIVGLKAGFIAILLPTFLHKRKIDPALGSGPFTTILQDTLSLLIYFLVAISLI
jgi:magnesium transporter